MYNFPICGLLLMPSILFFSAGKLPDCIYEEDIVCDPLEPKSDLEDYKRGALRDVHRLWDRKRIPYFLESGLSGECMSTGIRQISSD